MVTLEKEPDTILPMSPQELSDKLSEAGTSNDQLQSSFIGSDMVNSLGDGVPGYQTTGVDEGNDEEELQMTTPNSRPS